MIVYVDLLLIENLLMNSFLIFITSKTIHKDIKMKNLLFGGAFGALYTLTMLFKETRLLTSVPFQILIALIIISISFKTINLKLVFKPSIIYVTYSMLISGIYIYLKCLSEKGLFKYFLIGRVSIKDIMIYIPIAFMFIIFIFKTFLYLKNRMIIKNFIYDIELNYNGKIIKFKGFYDSGNDLSEPATGKPVVIIEKKALKDLYISEEDKLFIPYRVIGASFNTLEAFNPKEELIIYTDKNNYFKVDAVIAITNDKLSSIGDFEGLISRNIFNSQDGGLSI